MKTWHWGLRIARAHLSLTFDQGMLVRGGGASQHPQLWPDLVDSLLLNLERDVGGVGRETEAQRKEETHLESLAFWHTGCLLCNMQHQCLPALHPSSSLRRPFVLGYVPPPSRCGSSG